MRVLRKYDQFRRDCSIDVECEGCKTTGTDVNAYDDRNFWDNIVPNFKCKKCGKSTKDMGLTPDSSTTLSIYSEKDIN